MTSIYIPPTQAQQETNRALDQFRAAGSPGYKPEAQKYTWDQLRQLPSAKEIDSKGNQGSNWSSDPAYQDWQQRENRNVQGEQNAFTAWRAGNGSASPSGSKAPDMSAYGQSGGQQSGGSYSAYGQQRAQQPQYNASNVPRTPPQGAQQNDLSGQVPSNQIWAQAYNQASNQYGGNTQAQSWTMPGSSTSQAYNPTTGQYGPMTGGQSNAGNMAYNAINNRPPPITATATGVGGNQMPWQDAMTQRDAFVGNLSQRLGQYAGGQLTGPVTFDPNQLLSQANDQLANGTYYNPFAQQNQPVVGNYSRPFTYGDSTFQGYGQNPDVQRAMGNSTQYMQGDFQNPFGPGANNPQPTWGQQNYNPSPSPQRYQPAPGGHDLSGDIYYRPGTGPGASPGGSGNGQLLAPPTDDLSYRLPTPRQPYDDQAEVQRLRQQASQDNLRNYQNRNSDQPGPSVTTPRGYGSGSSIVPQQRPSRPAPATPIPEITFTPEQQAQLDAIQQASNQQEADKAKRVLGQAQPILPPSQGTPYNPQAPSQGLPPVPPTPSPRNESVAAPSQLQARQSKLAQIDDEIDKWQQATYGTWQGNGPPAEWSSHIQALQRLRAKAAAGDPAALAWNPKIQAPAAHVTPSVPVNMRGESVRSGGMRRNGDNRR